MTLFEDTLEHDFGDRPQPDADVPRRISPGDSTSDRAVSVECSKAFSDASSTVKI